MSYIQILWADDEIDLLKPQILYLENKGYQVIPVTNGKDAIDQCSLKTFDIIFLDESMPGLSGLETLTEIKRINSHIPIVMITKNEEEDLMEDAIGSQITDYLIKPVKPQQILLTLKKIVDNERLITQTTHSNYQKEFQQLFMKIQENLDHKSWSELYKKLVYWELELDKTNTEDMREVFTMQKQEANNAFCKFVTKHYKKWMQDDMGEQTPILSHTLMKRKIFDYIKEDKPTFLLLIDNLRLDQWKLIQPVIQKYFTQKDDDTFYSILPTATQYSRNAIFSGLTPLKIQAHFDTYWKHDHEEGGKNLYESELLTALLNRTFKNTIKHDYFKISNVDKGKELESRIPKMLHNRFNAIVYNFVDMLSHARTDVEVVKELANDESAYRSLTMSWFEHSPLHHAIKILSKEDINLIITTDHGTVRVKHPSKCVGDKFTSTNIRYKNGKNLQYVEKDVYTVDSPHTYGLPTSHINTRYIFAKESNYLIYANNYNKFVNYFADTFQHGGISLEEMIVPFASFVKK